MEKSGNFDNSGKIIENSGNFIKLFPSQGTLHFCLLNVTKKSPISKRKQEEKEMKKNLKRKTEQNLN